MKNENGEIKFGACCVRSFVGKKDFDKYYIDRVIKQVVQKTGEGEDDFIIVDKVIETKRDIAQEINAQMGDAGIDAYLKDFEMAGVNPMDSFDGVSKDIQDFSEMPDNLADSILLGEKARVAYASLPSELKKGLSYEKFITNFTQEKFDEYMASLVPPKVEEEKKGE